MDTNRGFFVLLLARVPRLAATPVYCPLQATRKSLTEKVERALADAARSRAACTEEKKSNVALTAERERLVLRNIILQIGRVSVLASTSCRACNTGGMRRREGRSFSRR